jgi:6-phosphogluconolactonase
MTIKNRMTFINSDTLAVAAANLFYDLATEHIKEKGCFSCLLSGGSTPKILYQKIANHPASKRIHWKKVQFFWGDERCVPMDHIESNYKMASDVLFSKLPIPRINIHRIKTELPPKQAAEEYQQEMSNFFSKKIGQTGLPSFDLVLLGMGTDGHTASLFPGTEALHETEKWVVANYVEKLNAWRITVTYKIINQARLILILAVGEQKAAVLKQILENEQPSGKYPIQDVQPVMGEALWLLDKKASKHLTKF